MINSKQKGKTGELELAKWFRDNMNCPEAGRGQQFKGGHDSPDVVRVIDGIHVECKRCERFDLYGALEQSTRDCKGTNKVPTVFYRKNKEPWVCVVKADELVAFTMALYKHIFEGPDANKNDQA